MAGADYVPVPDRSLLALYRACSTRSSSGNQSRSCACARATTSASARRTKVVPRATTNGCAPIVGRAVRMRRAPTVDQFAAFPFGLRTVQQRDECALLNRARHRVNLRKFGRAQPH